RANGKPARSPWPDGSMEAARTRRVARARRTAGNASGHHHRVRCHAGLGLQQAGQAQIELAADQADHAVELGAAELQPLDQLALGDCLHRVARGLDPPRGGGAMDMVERRELIDAEAVERVLAQYQARAVTGPWRASNTASAVGSPSAHAHAR